MKIFVAFIVHVLCLTNIGLCNVVVQSLDQYGIIKFSELTNAVNYRIEWSPDNVQWEKFSGDYGQWLDNIPATGSGVITASVPMFYRIVVTVPPEGMVYIPAGSFMMGNATNVFSLEEGASNELPQHEVYVDEYFIAKHEVTRELWNSISIAAQASWGYSFSNSAIGTSSEFPMGDISWHDAVKWCNARSEIEGYVPVYYTDSVFSNVYKSGEIMPYANWLENGYRLPTEAEWEKAARGGVSDTRFPWNDFSNLISHVKANYYAGLYGYDLSDGYFPEYYNNGFFSPTGYFSPPNSYGLYDMAGNVWEWCWDWVDASYYSLSPASNPKGPQSGSHRIIRGGSAFYPANYARCSARADLLPWLSLIDTGFRCVRRP